MIGCYVRVSSSVQASDGTAENQRYALSKWLEANGSPECQWFVDEAFSGRTTDRPAWTALNAQIASGAIQTVVASRMTRVGRSVADLSQWVRDMLARGVRVVFVKEAIDLDTATGRLFAHLLMAIGEFESEMIGERRSEGIQAKLRAGGKHGGQKNPGQRVGKSQAGVQRFTEKEIADVKAMYAAGMSCESIADRYSTTGKTVARTLKRAGVVLRAKSHALEAEGASGAVEPVAAAHAELVGAGGPVVDALVDPLGNLDGQA